MQVLASLSRPWSRRLGAALAAGATGLAVAAAAPALAATGSPKPAVIRSGTPASPAVHTVTPLVAISRTVVLAPRGAADLALPLRPAKGVGFSVAKARSVTMTVRLARRTVATKGHPAGTVTVVTATRAVRIAAGSYTVHCTLTAPTPAHGKQSQFSLACGLHQGATKVATITPLPVHFSLPGRGRQTLVWTLTVS